MVANVLWRIYLFLSNSIYDIRNSLPVYQLLTLETEIPQLVRASISRYIVKLNYASLNACHYEINDEQPASYSSSIIECITIISRSNNHFVSLAGCCTSIRTRCESRRRKCTFINTLNYLCVIATARPPQKCQWSHD